MCHLVNILAMRPVAAGSRRARPTDEARILQALAAGHAPEAGIGGAAGARLVEAWQTDRQKNMQTDLKTGRQIGRRFLLRSSGR